MSCTNPNCSHPYRSHLGRSGKPFRGGCCEPGCVCPGYIKPPPTPRPPATPRVAHPASAHPDRSGPPSSRPVAISHFSSYRARTTRDKDAFSVIGRRMEKVRHQLKLTKKEMAAKYNVSSPSYAAWTRTNINFIWPSMKYQRRLMELEGMVGILKGAKE